MCRCWRWSGIAEVMVARLWGLWWNICIITKIFTQWRRLPLITQVDIGGKNKHNKTSCTCLRLLLLYKIELNSALLMYWDLLMTVMITKDDLTIKSYIVQQPHSLPDCPRSAEACTWEVDKLNYPWLLMAGQDLLMAAQELDLPLARDVVHAHLHRGTTLALIWPNNEPIKCRPT